MNGHYIGDIHILPTSPDTKTQSPIPPSLFTGEQYTVPMQKTMTQQVSKTTNLKLTSMSHYLQHHDFDNDHNSY